MVMLCRIIDLERDRYLRIEAFNLKTLEIAFHIEDQTINAGTQIILNQKERFHPPIFVGPGVGQLHPGLVWILKFEGDGYTAGRSASRCIEDVGGDGAPSFSPLLIL